MRTLIKNGLIYDGSGEEPFQADILIENGLIGKIAKGITDSDTMVIDASSLLVTPGFIDTHRHADFALFNNSSFGFSELSQGITTILVGPCGMSAAPFKVGKSEAWYEFIEPCLGKGPDEGPATMKAYLDALSSLSLPLNVGAMVGMGSIRYAVKGGTATPWTDDEMAIASELLHEAISAGVFGISAGIMYTPEYYSTKEDYIRLLSSNRKANLPFVTHIRNEGDGLVCAVEEVLEIAKSVDIPLNISHFKVFGKSNWGKGINKAISLIEKARFAGQTVNVDFYPYTGGATTLMTLIPPPCMQRTIDETIEFLTTEEGLQFLRQEIQKKQTGWDNMVEAIGWDRIILSSVRTNKNKQFQGKDFSTIADVLGFDETETFVRILRDERGQAGIIVMSMDQKDVDTVASLPYSSVISDALYGSPDFPHPRLNGAFVKMLEEYAFSRGVVRPEIAIHKMTGKVAAFYQLKGRGLLRSGYVADINLISVDALKAEATFLHPNNLSKGIKKVLLSGRNVFENGKMAGPFEGSVLRKDNY